MASISLSVSFSARFDLATALFLPPHRYAPDPDGDKPTDLLAHHLPGARENALDLKEPMASRDAFTLHPAGKRIDVDVAEQLNQVRRIIDVSSPAIGAPNLDQIAGIVQL
ncbi:hypothetical protein [Aminobacter aminovorans]|uniref:hypothetical protein n=1 Tax=Aminobacter aminovorans TaxID=83263 RepID=UPI00105299A3|nr:hypothetical protein [Aminobacter aminovorans]